MTTVKTSSNTELRSMPFYPNTGYSMFRSGIDGAGRTELNAAMGDRVVATRVSSINLSFQLGYFLDQVREMNVNGGVVTPANNMILATAINAGDVAQLRTLQRVDYRTGFESHVIFDAIFTDYQGTAVVRQEIGLNGDLNGYLVAAINGQLAVTRRKSGVDLETHTQNEFNLDKLDGSGASGFLIDITKLNVYRIQFGFMGNMPVIYEIFGGHELGWIPFHVFDRANVQTEPEIDNPYLPVQIRAEVVSGSPNQDIIVSTNSWYVGSLDSPKTWADYTFFSVQSTKSVSSSGANLLVARNKSQFRSTVNFIPLNVSYFSGSTDGEGAGRFDIFANPTVTGESYTDVDTDRSVMEVDTGSFTISGGKYIGSIYLSREGNQIVQFKIDELRLNPSDVFAIRAETAKSAEISMSIRWGELR